MRHAAIRLVTSPIVLALALAAATLPLRAQSTAAAAPVDSTAPDSARMALARELLDAMQVGPTILQGLEQGIASQKAMNPRIPEVFWTEFRARAQRELPKFVESVAPIYASRFTAQELRDIIAFYRTPAGSHLATEGASLSAELMRTGQRWGAQIGADTAKELADKGIMMP